jgi:uncharacterized protein (TIGR01244 family)
MDFRELDKQVLVASDAVGIADMKRAAEKGVTLVVNNRPDGEEPGQPTAAELEQAARAEGMDYVHIPIDAELSADKVEALGAALAKVEGRALIFCRSGTRSTYLWALARARQGMAPETLDHNARRAGYKIQPIMSWLQRAAAAPE